MLHELLLVLSGHDSDLFSQVHTHASRTPQLQLATDLPFLHESERVIINGLCKLGTHCRQLQQYTSTYRLISPMLLHSPQQQRGAGGDVLSMYKRSICVGIDEILEKYQETLLQVEQDFYEECQQNGNTGGRGKIVLPLSYLVHELRDYETLFATLCDVVHIIESQRLKGGPLLDYVHRKSFSGTPLIKHAMERLLFHCNVIMIRHISSWMVFGRLVDKFDEFFIVEKSPQDSSSMDVDSEARLDDDDNNNNQIHNHGNANVECESDSQTWKHWFKLRMSMIPSYISLPLANKILFIGKAIRVLQHPDLNANSSMASFALAKADIISRSELHKFSEALQVHERTPVLHIPSFEYTVDRIRDAVARHLWNLIVVESNLVGHLSKLKDYFLLSKGDLFQYFIEDSQQLMSVPPFKNAEQDVRTVFLRAARKMHADVEDDFKEFQIRYEKSNVRITSTPIDSAASSRTISNNYSMISGVSSGTHSSENAKHETFDAWCHLSLQYESKWPLHLLFDQDVVDLYNSLFQFLFVVKRVQLNLQQSWTPLVRYRRTSPSLLRPLLMLRSRMGFFIDNLQFYLHVDVIATQFKHLEDSILASKDFETIKRAHENYINALIVQCFLNVVSSPATAHGMSSSEQSKQQSHQHGVALRRETASLLNTSITTASSTTTGGSVSLRHQIMTQLELIFRHCMTLCYIVQKEESRKLKPGNQKEPFESEELKFRITKLAREFDFELSCLFKILSAAKYPHLQQLMLRIDYNKFLSARGKI